MHKVVVMGVSGCGKTSVGEALAALLSARFVEGDRLHPPANVAKMSAGTPLTDADRWPWLDAVGRALVEKAPAVASCSALRLAYRERLRSVAGADVFFLFLDVSRQELQRRMAMRRNHFMPPSLLDSQHRTLERPDNEAGVLTVDGARSVSTISQEAAGWLAKSKEISR